MKVDNRAFIKKILFIGICLYGTASITLAHEEQTHYDRIHLNASASTEVEQDELRANLYAISQDTDSSSAANAVSERIRKALAVLSQYKSIDVQTGNFSTHPVYKKQQITGWRSRQNITLKTTDASKLSELIGQLQHHLNMENISYHISSQRRQQVENKLIEQAIKNFRQRARLVTSSLNREKFRLVDMNINTGHAGPVHRQRFDLMEARTAAAPAIVTGSQTITVSISGQVEVQIK